ncbi:uncharacterized protein PV06_05707 [Exophiala oligosperma]|uniref:Uncharacterized protein n=1 Tax=Exophiala oligosperma TaxID=215243 RepID=A0A0D2BX89_9EURO|nr:uncharacterized protein PV06_05707 [Exophiala oligosperma]KIW42122.1 hypothetical protein PV06_05707 [Exophiala oligosperma]
MTAKEVVVVLNRTETSPVTSTPAQLTCVFNYVWDGDREVGRAYLSTVNGCSCGAALDDGSGTKSFAGAPVWVTNQLMGGPSFEVSKFALKVGKADKDTKAAIWVKQQDNKEKLLYKSANY